MKWMKVGLGLTLMLTMVTQVRAVGILKGHPPSWTRCVPKRCFAPEAPQWECHPCGGWFGGIQLPEINWPWSGKGSCGKSGCGACSCEAPAAVEAPTCAQCQPRPVYQPKTTWKPACKTEPCETCDPCNGKKSRGGWSSMKSRLWGKSKGSDCDSPCETCDPCSRKRSGITRSSIKGRLWGGSDCSSCDDCTGCDNSGCENAPHHRKRSIRGFFRDKASSKGCSDCSESIHPNNCACPACQYQKGHILEGVNILPPKAMNGEKKDDKESKKETGEPSKPDTKEPKKLSVAPY